MFSLFMDLHIDKLYTGIIHDVTQKSVIHLQIIWKQAEEKSFVRLFSQYFGLPRYTLQPFFGKNHPCKHLGAGEGVLNFTRASSFRVLESNTKRATVWVSSPPHTTALINTPSSSSCKCYINIYFCILLNVLILFYILFQLNNIPK